MRRFVGGCAVCMQCMLNVDCVGPVEAREKLTEMKKHKISNVFGRFVGTE